MRKNKLIEMLQKIEGNPDIYLWNGMVGDWMDVASAVEDTLTKESLEHYTWMRSWRSERDTPYQIQPDAAQMKKDYAKYITWEQNQYITEQDIKDGRYKTKRVVFLDAKQRGITTFDRGGDISY